MQKVDTEGNALEGAVLENETQEEDGFTPIRFTTTKDKYYPQGLKADVTYVLSEITPPQGYSVAEPVSFVLKADGSVCIDGVTATDGRQVTMVDKAVTVYVAKKDLSTRKSLKGAKLAIKNEAGETLYSFVSEKEKPTNRRKRGHSEKKHQQKHKKKKKKRKRYDKRPAFAGNPEVYASSYYWKHFSAAL